MKAKSGIKIVCDNRKAFHNYQIEDKVEAGLVLKGTEVKALRSGGGAASIRDSYAVFNNGEIFLLNAHISPYEMGNRENHEPTRTRKLLLKKEEIQKLWGRLEVRGYSLIPLKIYFKQGLAKVELGVGKGKKTHDKRATSKERSVKREMDRAIRRGR